jgi:hypothetical protein
MSGSGTGIFQYIAPTDFRIAQVPDNVPPEFVTAFNQVYAAIQQIIFSLVVNCGIGPRNTDQWTDLAATPYVTLLAGNLNRLYVEASEDISFGAAVNLYNNGGTLGARNANATNNTKPCRAFCSSVDGISSGTVGEVLVNAGTATISGLTPGTSYFLSTTNGLIANSPAVAAGNIEQFVGVAVTDSVLSFNLNYWIQH